MGSDAASRGVSKYAKSTLSSSASSLSEEWLQGAARDAQRQSVHMRLLIEDS